MAFNIDLNKIRENADIVNVISSYLPLQPKGRNYVCVCPFTMIQIHLYLYP